MERISGKNSPFKSENTKSFDEKLKNSFRRYQQSFWRESKITKFCSPRASKLLSINLRRVVESNEKADLDGRVTSLNKIQTPKNQLDYNAAG